MSPFLVQQWEKRGLILAPDIKDAWRVSHVGAACAVPAAQTGQFRIYASGRDAKNRSRIGSFVFDLEAEQVLSIDAQPVISLGEHGSFDENGTSYPWIVTQGESELLYYTGWVPSVLTPFQNDVGLAQGKGTEFHRVSRAPILHRTDADPFCMGSVCVLREEAIWKMWYTSFKRWGNTPEEPKHFYHIKYAESQEGIHWARENKVCIDFKDENEYAIARPSVLKVEDTYHMWFCARGEEYQLGYAYSRDGIVWQRVDEAIRWRGEQLDWDDTAQCYPFVFRYKSFLYMLYNGNEYGKAGLGLARLHLDSGT